LQTDLDNFAEWASRWQLRFNADKCHVLHLGQRNPQHTYTMKKHASEERVTLEASGVERDLGVMVDRGLKFSVHVETQVNKANRLLGLIRRSFTYLDASSMRQLFVALVRPHLEFGNVAWSPRFEKDKNLIEGVLRRATKLIPSLKDYEYEERLRRIGLPSMRHRRDRGDMIEVFKYTHGLYKVNCDLLIPDTSRVTRGHDFKLLKRRCRLNVRQHFFSMRVIDKWNNLPASIVNVPTLDDFKCCLDNYWASAKFCA